jgi:hypothetical protein
MTDIGRVVYRKRMSLKQACILAGCEFEEGMTIPGYSECSSCSVWHLETELIPDLDGLPICRICDGWYGH